MSEPKNPDEQPTEQHQRPVIGQDAQQPTAAEPQPASAAEHEAAAAAEHRPAPAAGAADVRDLGVGEGSSGELPPEGGDLAAGGVG